MKSCLHEIPHDFALRRGLKAMFHYQDVDKVMDALCTGYQYLYKSFLVEQLNGLLRMEPEGCTIDQNESCSKWFAQTYVGGVFDALFDFSKSCGLLTDERVACTFEGVMRWHEMSSLLSEDLLVCAFLAAKSVRPKDYAWAPHINTDCDALNKILGKDLADIHAHLKGSSLNFDVNWMCLMNHIEGRGKLFADIQNGLQNKIVSLQHKNSRRSFYMLSVIACAIRVVLFSRIKHVCTDTEKMLLGVMQSYNDLDASTMVSSILNDVKAFTDNAYKYVDEETGIGSSFDYAHTSDIRIPEKEGCAFSALSGERALLCAILGRIADGSLNDYDASLFYIYLLIKHKIRHELVQTNEETGFKNFQLYDNRKTLFVAGNPDYAHYRTLLHHLSVASMFSEGKVNRWLETRITPKGKSQKLEDAIKAFDCQIADGRLKRHPAAWNYGYILHYIKTIDDFDPSYFSLKVRHEDLRNRVKQQAKAIVQARRLEDERVKDGLIPRQRILGIDAASSEIACRPEVFAQAFRFCRRSIPDIGITYHVGEDFHDVTDGLRAIDECVRFLDMRSVDRLGHALALGTDVHDYYQKRRFVITMPKQVALDNAMWLYVKLAGVFLHSEARKMLHKVFDDLFRDVFKDYNCSVDIDTYYLSWLLRGDNPILYRQDGSVASNDDVDVCWHLENCCTNSDANRARSIPEACRLFYYYHRSPQVKKSGAELIIVEYPKAIIQAIELVQRRMTRMIARKGLCIECNPTSNFKIGEIDRYENHPISKFHSRGLKRCRGNHISASINTDDKGVFATSLEREYALISAALIRHYGNTKKAERKVLSWIDDIREHSTEQKFIR